MIEVIYLHGFASGPSSSKACFFRQKLEEIDVKVSIPDLASGDFERLTITGQLDVLDKVVRGRRVALIGSSLGGYLAALYAARHPLVEQLVLMAPAFSFGARFPQIFGEAEMERWRTSGWKSVFHYGENRERRLSYELMADAANYEDFPNVTQPTLVLHGTKDDVVPSELSEAFVGRHSGARLVLLPSGHELTDVKDRLWAETAQFLRLSEGGNSNGPPEPVL